MIPGWGISAIVASGFVAASFRLWLDERRMRESLESELATFKDSQREIDALSEIPDFKLLDFKASFEAENLAFVKVENVGATSRGLRAFAALVYAEYDDLPELAALNRAGPFIETDSNGNDLHKGSICNFSFEFARCPKTPFYIVVQLESDCVSTGKKMLHFPFVRIVWKDGPNCDDIAVDPAPSESCAKVVETVKNWKDWPQETKTQTI